MLLPLPLIIEIAAQMGAPVELFIPKYFQTARSKHYRNLCNNSGRTDIALPNMMGHIAIVPRPFYSLIEKGEGGATIH